MPRKPKYTVPTDPKTVGMRLRELRKQRGLTQVELAARLGMKQALISNYERGKLRMHGGIVVAFARALHVTTDEILAVKKPKNGFFPDRRFLRRLQKIELLSKRDKQVLLTTIDALLRAAERRLSS